MQVSDLESVSVVQGCESESSSISCVCVPPGSRNWSSLVGRCALRQAVVFGCNALLLVSEGECRYVMIRFPLIALPVFSFTPTFTWTVQCGMWYAINNSISNASIGNSQCGLITEIWYNSSHLTANYDTPCTWLCNKRSSCDCLVLGVPCVPVTVWWKPSQVFQVEVY